MEKKENLIYEVVVEFLKIEVFFVYFLNLQIDF